MSEKNTSHDDGVSYQTRRTVLKVAGAGAGGLALGGSMVGSLTVDAGDSTQDTELDYSVSQFLDNAPRMENSFDIDKNIYQTSDTKQHGWNYEYYEGSWGQVPTFDDYQPEQTGTTDKVGLSNINHRDDNFAVRFSGYLSLDSDTQIYTALTSDDGSILWIDGTKIIDNDGRHGSRTVGWSTELTEGTHEVVVGYLEAGGDQVVSLGESPEWPHVQNWAPAIDVAPDGTVYTTANWDEAGHECSVYRNGYKLPQHKSDGGTAITVDSDHVYVDRNNQVEKFDRHAYTPVNFTQPDSNTLNVDPEWGLETDGDHLYVSSGSGTPVDKYDKTTGEHLTTLGTFQDTLEREETPMEIAAGEHGVWCTKGIIDRTIEHTDQFLTMRADGDDIYRDIQQFRFSWVELSGDFDVTLKTRYPVDGPYKAGLMARETLTSDGAYVFTRGGGNVDQNYGLWRLDQNGDFHGDGEAPGPWVRLVRSGNDFTAYGSEDGSTWQKIATGTQDMNNSLYVGAAATGWGELTDVSFSEFTGFGTDFLKNHHTQDIGYTDDETMTFRGVIADRTYTQEITNLTGNGAITDGLIANYSFESENLDDPYVYDDSGNGHDGEEKGGDVTYDQSTSTPGPAALFERANSETIEVPDPGVDPDSYTVSTWVKTTGTGGWATPLAKANSMWCGFKGTTGKPRLDPSDRNNVDVVANTAVDDGSWHHVVYRVSKAENRIEIYIDGSLDSGKDAFDAHTSTNSLAIASKSNSADYYDGELAEVRFYDRALSESEIDALYQQEDEPIEMPDAGARDISFTPTGLLAVADDSSDQQIKFYDVSVNPPQLDHTLGQQDGIFSGTPGAYGDYKLSGPNALGVDQDNNTYVCTGSNGGRPFDDDAHWQTDIRAFSGPQADGGELLWNTLGLGFVDAAAFDPDTPENLYTETSHVQLDYQTSPDDSDYEVGDEWDETYDVTRDWFSYDDTRVSGRVHFQQQTVVACRNIQGYKYIFLTSMSPTSLGIYRKDPNSEVFQPVGLIFASDTSKTAENWPENAPQTNPWIWTDDNDDGQLQESEFETADQLNDTNGWHVGPDGDIWMAAGKKQFQKLPLDSVDDNGMLSYRASDIQSFSVPDEFRNVKDLSYSKTDDLMYIGGLKPGTDRGAWKALGDRIVCYKNWSSGQPEVKWKKDLSWDDSNKPTGLAIAGELLFFGRATSGHINVVDRETGDTVGEMVPDSVGGSGWLDVAEPIDAVQRESGEYLVAVEEDKLGRILLYRLSTIPQDGPVAEYAFDSENVEDGTVYDQSGNGYDGEEKGSGTITYDQDASPGPSVVLDSADSQTIEITGGDTPDPASYTVSLWFKTTSSASFTALFAQAGSVYCSLDSGQIFFDATDGGGGDHQVRSSATNLNDGSWHHVVYRASESEDKYELYVDNSLDGSTTPDSYATASSSNNPAIGSKSNQGDHYTGEIAEVRWYDRALSESEIDSLYQEGT